MAEITIKPEHREYLARTQHVLEWLGMQRDRLIADLNHVTRQGDETQRQLTDFLHAGYAVDTGTRFTLDSERGVIVTPDTAEPAEAEPEEPESPFLGRD